jgi:hypothetical protein
MLTKAFVTGTGKDDTDIRHNSDGEDYNNHDSHLRHCQKRDGIYK